jgi:uncharacterized repeat protein (TIGR01451 family)
MSISKNVFKVAGVTTVALAVLAAAPVFADGTGNVEGGNIYRVKNVTQNVNFSNPASANACDELEYSVQLHNSGYDAVNNVVVSATLPASASTSSTSNVTAAYSDGVNPSTSASATVNLSSSQTISYVSGSTELLDGKGNVLKTLSDGVTGNGVNIGTIDGSTTEYVNFEAKVGCPTTPVTTPTTPASTTTPAAPSQLVNTGPGSVIAIFAAASAAGAVAYRWITARRLSRQ